MKKKPKKPKQPNTRRPAPRPRERGGSDPLAEFSDDYNEFYVDEVAESRRREREERAARREDARAARRKPLSPFRRKVIRIAGTALIVAVILIVGVILSLTVLFKTGAYEVNGNTLYYESDIIETCGIKEGENIFLAPKGPAARRIVDRFPYIESADVSFKIPDTIKIDITQATEGYLFKVSDTEYLVISTKGCVLNRVADKSGFRLPVFIGPQLKSGEIGEDVVYEDPAVLEIIDSIMQVFADNGYQGITEVDATDISDLSFTYDGRIKVKIGLPEELSYKIRTAMTVISGSIDVTATSRQQGTLDVSRSSETKRAYFREGDIAPTEAQPSQPSQPTEAPTESAEDTSWDDDVTWDEDVSWDEGEG